MKFKLFLLFAATFSLSSCGISNSDDIVICLSDSLSSCGISKSDNIVICPSESSKDSSFCIKCGDTVDIVGGIWASVGSSFDVECDSVYFEKSESLKFKHPEDVANMKCGGDEATLKIKLKSTKTGKTKVSYVSSFRGEIVKQVDYTISIE